MQPTPYAELNRVLPELVTRVRIQLRDDFIAAYLQGSFAVGDFDTYSDVDFLIVVEEDVADDRLPSLPAVHSEIYDLPPIWARRLEGSYVPKAALRHRPPPRHRFLYLDHGSRELVRSDHDDSLVVYWVLREKAVTLIGPDPRSLVSPVSAHALRREILGTMRDWRQELLAHPDKLNNRFYQPFVVLSYCRMLNTLATGRVESKRAGAVWALGVLDPRWHRLIRRAWHERGDPSSKARQPADSKDLEATWIFMEHAEALGRQWNDRNSWND
jgi:hypothetical protein